MPLLILAQQDPHGPGIDPMHAEHANYAAAVWALVLFAILFFVLWKKAWGPIVAGLQSREDKINESLKRAEELERATRELQETNRKAMEKAQQEAQSIVAEARVAAQRAAAEVAAKANADIEASRDRFQREMRLEADKVRDEIRREAVDITLAATAKVIGKSLTAADHRRLAEDALRDADTVARN